MSVYQVLAPIIHTVAHKGFFMLKTDGDIVNGEQFGVYSLLTVAEDFVTGHK